MIRFLPLPGTLAPSSGAYIVKGEYNVRNKGGVPVGSHRVSVEGYRPRQGNRPAEDADMPGVRKGEVPSDQYLPPKYNKESELTLIVPEGVGSMVENFELIP